MAYELPLLKFSCVFSVHFVQRSDGKLPLRRRRLETHETSRFPAADGAAMAWVLSLALWSVQLRNVALESIDRLVTIVCGRCTYGVVGKVALLESTHSFATLVQFPPRIAHLHLFPHFECDH